MNHKDMSTRKLIWVYFKAVLKARRTELDKYSAETWPIVHHRDVSQTQRQVDNIARTLKARGVHLGG